MYLQTPPSLPVTTRHFEKYLILLKRTRNFLIKTKVGDW